ncbi:hypothetical protein Pelo_18030 [Pelomyxa schiedti]|nr:hypothetical protein Pelo_18030 [Pelomyxa schiedti]
METEKQRILVLSRIERGGKRGRDRLPCRAAKVASLVVVAGRGGGGQVPPGQVLPGARWVSLLPSQCVGATLELCSFSTSDLSRVGKNGSTLCETVFLVESVICAAAEATNSKYTENSLNSVPAHKNCTTDCAPCLPAHGACMGSQHCNNPTLKFHNNYKSTPSLPSQIQRDNDNTRNEKPAKNNSNLFQAKYCKPPTATQEVEDIIMKWIDNYVRGKKPKVQDAAGQIEQLPVTIASGAISIPEPQAQVLFAYEATKEFGCEGIVIADLGSVRATDLSKRQLSFSRSWLYILCGTMPNIQAFSYYHMDTVHTALIIATDANEQNSITARFLMQPILVITNRGHLWDFFMTTLSPDSAAKNLWLCSTPSGMERENHMTREKHRQSKENIKGLQPTRGVGVAPTNRNYYTNHLHESHVKVSELVTTTAVSNQANSAMHRKHGPPMNDEAASSISHIPKKLRTAQPVPKDTSHN